MPVLWCYLKWFGSKLLNGIEFRWMLSAFAILKLLKILAGTNLFAMKLMNSKSVRSKLWLKFIFFTRLK